MYALICLAIAVSVITAEPGIFPEYELGGFHGAPLFAGHAAPALPAPVLSPALFKAPVIAPAPVFAPAPVIAPAPIIKAVAPVFKHVAPATSYATVTQFHVTHPASVVKTFVAPQPIVKTLALPAPIAFGHGHGFH